MRWDSAAKSARQHQRRRLRHPALHLLEHTDLHIGEISAVCGISDANYFTRAFAQRELLSPRAWRKRQCMAALQETSRPVR